MGCRIRTIWFSFPSRWGNCRAAVCGGNVRLQLCGWLHMCLRRRGRCHSCRLCGRDLCCRLYRCLVRCGRRHPGRGRNPLFYRRRRLVFCRRDNTTSRRLYCSRRGFPRWGDTGLICTAGRHTASGSRCSGCSGDRYRILFCLRRPSSRYRRGDRLYRPLLCIGYGCMVFHAHPLLMYMPWRRRHDWADLTRLLGAVWLRCSMTLRRDRMTAGLQRVVSAILQRLFRRPRRDRRDHMAGLLIRCALRYDRRQSAVCLRRVHAAKPRRQGTHGRGGRHHPAACFGDSL